MLKNNRSVLLSSDELALQFNKNTINAIENIEVETFTNKIMKNARMKKFTVTLLGLSLYFKTALAAAKGIDSLGWTLLALVRHWAYWILLIWCIVDVIRSGLSGESKKTLPIILKYVIIFASMYLIPAIFDAIKTAF